MCHSQNMELLSFSGRGALPVISHIVGSNFLDKHTKMNFQLDLSLDGMSSADIAGQLYDYIDKVETEKFIALMDAVAEQIFQDKRTGKDPRWNMNYIVNEWVKMNNLRRTLLFQATFHNNIDIVQALLDHGVCMYVCLFYFILYFI